MSAAFISGTPNLTIVGTSGQNFVTAEDTTTTRGLAGGVGVAVATQSTPGFAIGVGIAYNHIHDQADAYITNSTLQSASKLTVGATMPRLLSADRRRCRLRLGTGDAPIVGAALAPVRAMK